MAGEIFIGYRRSDAAKARLLKGFKSRSSTQRFLETRAAIYNAFNVQPHLLSRKALRTFRSRSDSVWSRRSRRRP